MFWTEFRPNDEEVTNCSSKFSWLAQNLHKTVETSVERIYLKKTHIFVYDCVTFSLYANSHWGVIFILQYRSIHCMP